MTNEELVKIYQETGDGGALDEVCRRNAGLVGAVVKRLKWVYRNETTSAAAVTESSDLMQDGLIELIKAVKDYKPGSGAAFSTFATKYIQTGIFRQIRDRGGALHIPAHKRGQLAKLRSLREFMSKNANREPNRREICAAIGISANQAAELLKLEQCANVTSLEKPITGDGLTLADTIPDGSDHIAAAENEIYSEELRAALWGAVDSLDGAKPEIIHRHYENGETIRDIGASLNMPVWKTAQMKDRALSELRKGQRGRILAEYADSYQKAVSAAYNGGLSSYCRTGTSPTERAAIMLTEAEETARRAADQGRKLNAAGMSRAERKQFYEMLEQKQREDYAKILQELKKGIKRAYKPGRDRTGARQAALVRFFHALNAQNARRTDF